MLPVVFVHGLIGPFSDTRTVSLLRPAVVVSPDLLGYGAEADADPSEITIEAQVEYVRATVDRMAPNSRMHLVWHSVGGVIAASFVHRFPRWCHMLRDAAAARGMTQERVADAMTPHVHNSTKQQNTKQQKEGKKIGLGKIKRI